MDGLVLGLIVTISGSFINFLSTKIYNSFADTPKNFFWKNKFLELESIKSNMDFDELKKRTRIVVIDDEDSFPVSLFLSEGYTIDKWDLVKDYGKLENGVYDLIILDIKGVAQHISSDDGLGVLESIKRRNPAQIIIAYSQHSFDLSKSKFWELADEKIAKPSDFLKVKNVVDNIISNLFKPSRYIKTLHQILRKKGVDEKEIRRLDTSLAKAISKKNTPNWYDLFHVAGNDTELFNQLKTIGNTILKFF